MRIPIIDKDGEAYDNGCPTSIETDTVFAVKHRVVNPLMIDIQLGWRIYCWNNKKKTALFGYATAIPLNRMQEFAIKMDDVWKKNFDWIIDEPLLALADAGMISWIDYHKAIT